MSGTVLTTGRPPRRKLGTPVWLALSGLILLTVLSLLSLLYVPEYPFTRVNTPLQPSTIAVWFGTDEAGRDLMARTMAGLTNTWLPDLEIVAVTAIAGSLIGALSGMSSGWLGRVTHIPINLFRAMPAPVMAAAAVAVTGRSMDTLAAALMLFGWPWYARMVRSTVIAARQTTYAEAARLTRPGHLLYFLPAALPPLAVAMAFDLGNTAVILSVLSFLGLGDPPPVPELGSMVHGGLGFLLDDPRVALIPAVMVFGIAMLSNAAGAAFRRRLLTS